VRRLGVAVGLAIPLLVAACTSGSTPPVDRSGSSPSLVPPSPESPSPAPDGPDSAEAALKRLCTVKAPKPGGGGGSDVPAEGPTPPAIQQVMDQLEQIRGFDFEHRVVADPVTPAEISRGFRQTLDATFPVDLYERRSTAWQTIGVIPAGTEIRDEVSKYGSSQVIGYYDTTTGKLVFIGGEDPTPLESVTLAHELTHAIDDQRFGLERLDTLTAECQDDASEGGLGLVEGNATYFMYDWARTFLSPDQQVELAQEAGSQDSPTPDVVPFIERQQIWPYTAGLRFVTQLNERGGLDAVDQAFEHFPVSTEQIMHPERYPNDVPTPVDVSDLSSALGAGWKDLDVMDVGEMWLDIALGLRLDTAEADAAAAGWDGGIYRAWSDGSNDVAVVLETTWDTERDAQEFHDTMADWIADGDGSASVLATGAKDVLVLFASDGATLQRLEAAATA
jgi:hypothetical protein